MDTIVCNFISYFSFIEGRLLHYDTGAIEEERIYAVPYRAEKMSNITLHKALLRNKLNSKAHVGKIKVVVLHLITGVIHPGNIIMLGTALQA